MLTLAYELGAQDEAPDTFMTAIDLLSGPSVPPCG